MIRKLERADCEIISAAFAGQGWDKPVSQYEKYFDEQTEKKRDVLLFFSGADFSGYVTVNYEPRYAPFAEGNIPEICDLNVLKKFQRRGIAMRLIKKAEEQIARKSKVAGIGVGLTADYGPAQRLYIRLGYMPDGEGATYKGRPLSFGNPVIADDSLVLWMTKAVIS